MSSRLMRQFRWKPTAVVAAGALLSVGVMSATAHAQAKDCGELKREIAAKLVAKGVTAYSLDVVAADAVAEGQVVGSCAGGTQRIVYVRGGAETDTVSGAAEAGAQTQELSVESSVEPAAD